MDLAGEVTALPSWSDQSAEVLRLSEEIARLRADNVRLARANEKDERAPEPAGTAEPKRPLPERVAGSARRHPVRSIAFAILALALVLIGWRWLRYLHSYEGTDDAQVDGDITALGARVAGTVTAVHVVDNQWVKAGDLLAELDPSDYTLALARARAALAQAKADEAASTPNVAVTELANRTNIQTSRGDVRSTLAEIGAAERDHQAALARESEAEAQAANAVTEEDRSRQLFETGAVSTGELDNRRTTARAAAANLEAARAAAESARQKLAQAEARLGPMESRAAEVQGNAPRQLESQREQVASRAANTAAAEAALRQAELDLSYTRVSSPVAGVVGRKAINVGDRVQAGQQLLAIVQVGSVWVTANYRETQLGRMHPGQKTRVHVDSFDRMFDAVVESMPAATGARFSLFPPENATGNYVKVVQRLPVRIHFADGQDGLDRLRPGMSVEPKVYVGER